MAIHYPQYGKFRDAGNWVSAPISNEKYRTPPNGMTPLRPFLTPGATFIDPCAGDGRIARYIPGCVQQFDLEPDDLFIAIGDALTAQLSPCDFICSNPPWSRHLLHPMITRFRSHAPTWLLFDADWAYTKQAAPFMIYCRYVVSLGGSPIVRITAKIVALGIYFWRHRVKQNSSHEPLDNLRNVP